jgi:hypothetical protein
MCHEMKDSNDISAIRGELSEDIIQTTPASVDEEILLLELDFRLRKNEFF